MSNIDAGGPAFPLDFRLVEAMSRAIEVSKLDKNEKAEGLRRLGDSACGMTLRDYFAAKAMQGLLAAWIHGVPEDKTITAAAYKYADAMLEARKK